MANTIGRSCLRSGWAGGTLPAAGSAHLDQRQHLRWLRRAPAMSSTSEIEGAPTETARLSAYVGRDLILYLCVGTLLFPVAGSLSPSQLPAFGGLSCPERGYD